MRALLVVLVAATALGQDIDSAKKLFEAKDYNAAYAQLVKADQLQPDLPAMLYDMAVTLVRAGRLTEAQARIDRYNQLYPEGAEKPLLARVQLELAFQRELQKKREADADYNALFTRGKYLYEQHDLDGALHQFEEAERKRPTEAAAIFDQAVIFETRGGADKAAALFLRYAALQPSERAVVEQRVRDITTKLLCPFCGFRLALGSIWCPRCWHLAGALRYTPARQAVIQEERKHEGWRYDGEVLTGGGLVQGRDYLERAGTLAYAAHQAGEVWLLDREDLVVDGQRFTSRYTFDGQNRVVRQDVAYVTPACGHLVAMTADVAPDGIHVHGGYDGFPAEGSPHVEWQGVLKDGALTVTSFTKTYPQRRHRDDLCPDEPVDVRAFYVFTTGRQSSSGQSAISN